MRGWLGFYMAVALGGAVLSAVSSAFGPDVALTVVAVLGALLLYGVVAYVVDVLLRPLLAARHARRRCDRWWRKPLLNIGAGTPGSSLRARIFGPTLWGDVNLDIAATQLLPEPGKVTYGDAEDLIEWPDKHFGAVVASHVLEHVTDPHRAMRELHRVACEVYVITPAWWAPHTWLHPGHRWFRFQDGRSVALRRQ